MLLNGLVRALAEESGTVGVNGAGVRTSLYAALLVCASLSAGDGAGRRRKVWDERWVCVSAKRSRTEIVMGSACADAVGGD